ncbi:MAG TPA: hypothetical protein VGE93_08820 [Bryobacteraceae bacterium]
MRAHPQNVLAQLADMKGVLAEMTDKSRSHVAKTQRVTVKRISGFGQKINEIAEFLIST